MADETKEQLFALMLSQFLSLRFSHEPPAAPLPAADELLERLRRIGIAPADIGLTEEKSRLLASYWGPKAGTSSP